MYLNKMKTGKKECIEKCISNFKKAKTVKAKTAAAEELRTHARSEHGLVDTRLRAQAWPILLNVDAIVKRERKEQGLPAIVWPLKDSSEWKKHLKDYPDKHQVEVDVKRTLHTPDVCRKWSDEEK